MIKNLLTQIRDKRRKSDKIKKEKDLELACLIIVVVDLADWLRFFIGAVVSLGIDKAVNLAIGRAISMKTNIAVGFFGLSL